MADSVVIKADASSAASGLSPEAESLARRAREHLGAGIGLGALSLGAAAMGAVCPLCVVAVPALLGSGVWHKLKARRASHDTSEASEETPKTP